MVYKSKLRELGKTRMYFSLMFFDFNPTLASFFVIELMNKKPSNPNDSFYKSRVGPYNMSQSVGYIDYVFYDEETLVINYYYDSSYALDSFIKDIIDAIAAKDFVIVQFMKQFMCCKCAMDSTKVPILDKLFSSKPYSPMQEGNFLFSALSHGSIYGFLNAKRLYKRDRHEGSMKTKVLIEETMKIWKK